MRQYFIYLISLIISFPASAQNVGIDVPNPGAKLEVAGGVKISDSINIGGQVRIISGTPGAGKVLTSNATGLASWQTPTSSSPCGLTIGQTYQGGIIFYLDPSGCHGLISAPTDQSTAAAWWNGSYLDTRAYGMGLFEGFYNTILAQGGNTSTGAARICVNLVLGGFSDWYLPSIYELWLMRQHIGQGNSLGLGNVGGFASATYWSSTERNSDTAWYVAFDSGTQLNSNKMTTYRVRAVRAF